MYKTECPMFCLYKKGRGTFANPYPSFSELSCGQHYWLTVRVGMVDITVSCILYSHTYCQHSHIRIEALSPDKRLQPLCRCQYYGHNFMVPITAGLTPLENRPLRIADNIISLYQKGRICSYK